ncbi:MAG: hypothetical protein NC306_12640 [Butyrivibrio sp.]|nr:hypothetical protein [Butyrivibrio sp.]
MFEKLKGSAVCLYLQPIAVAVEEMQALVQVLKPVALLFRGDGFVEAGIDFRQPFL